MRSWAGRAAAADALAMDRRLFLQTAGGMAALLTTINLAACTSQARTSARPATPGGRYRTPPHAPSMTTAALVIIAYPALALAAAAFVLRRRDA